MAISDYSTTAGSNTTLFPENQAPSSVNDGARQFQADVRTWYNTAEWLEIGDGSGSYTATGLTADSFKITGSDVTAVYHPGRRIRIAGSLTGTIWAYIASSSFSSDTTVYVTGRTGDIASEALTVVLGIISANPSSLPKVWGASTASQQFQGDRVDAGAILELLAQGKNDTDQIVSYAAIRASIESQATGQQSGSVQLVPWSVGVESVQLDARYDGVVLDQATGGGRGTGTINTKGVYVNGVEISGAASEALAGIIALATSAEVLAGEDATKAVTPANLAAGISLATAGYCKLPGGFIVQWGSFSTGSDGNGAIGFPIAFVTACYVVLPVIKSVASTLAVTYSAESVTGCAVHLFNTITGAGTATSGGGRFVAIGK